MGQGRYAEPRTEEERYLADLLGDFGEKGHPDVGAALTLIYQRYRELERQVPRLALFVDAFSEDGTRTSDAFLVLLIGLHDYLYGGILRNAGQFRETTDPNGGTVRFGGAKGQSQRARYYGTSPREIDEAIREALRLLEDAADPVRSAVYFYLELSAIHPFYDANGRIGRVLVSIYLFRHGYYVNWDQLDGKHRQFMKQLNACLDRRKLRVTDAEKYERYRIYLFNFWQPFVEPLAAFYDE